jgi:thiamine-phosphate pyrophosphorylase
VNAEARCRVYAVIEAGPRALAHLAAALAARGIAALLVTAPADGEQLAPSAVAELITAAQRAGVAALIGEDADLARQVGADGVHLGACTPGSDVYAAARRRLGPDAIVGADGGISRHAAMALAEAGADYIAFGAPRHLKDRARARARREELVAWWAEIFAVPCVAFDVESAAEATALDAAGADFIAVTLPTHGPAAAGELLAEIDAAMLPRSAA